MSWMIPLMFLLGTLIGSFLNVCIYRIPNHLSIAWPASHCPKCNTPLKPMDLIPLLSWLAMRGKCRYCKDSISFQYPLFELVTGLLTAALFVWISDPIQYSVALLLLYNGLVISAIDWNHHIIPDWNNLFYFALGVILSALRCYAGDYGLFIDGILGCLAAFLIMLVFVLINVWGAGDLKLMASVGLILGVKLILLAMWLGIVFGGAYGLFLVLSKRKSSKERMAFGPALITGILVSYIVGNNLINSYLSLLA